MMAGISGLAAAWAAIASIGPHCAAETSGDESRSQS
jgi:hypothetical protein